VANHETKFDEERQRRILMDLADGQTRACAAERSGISERTLSHWLTQGRRGVEPYVAFVALVKKAEREAESEAVREIRTAGKRNWTAYAWWLERKFPESWGKDTELLREIIAAYRKRKRAKVS